MLEDSSLCEVTHCQFISTNQNDIPFQKTSLFINSAIRTPSFAYITFYRQLLLIHSSAISRGKFNSMNITHTKIQY